MTREIKVKPHLDTVIYGVVRGPDGKPKIDGDPAALHPNIVALLTVAEKDELGLWSGPAARDAQGIKRLQQSANETLVALDALTAASLFWIDGVCYKSIERVDVPAGGTFNLKEA